MAVQVQFCWIKLQQL